MDGLGLHNDVTFGARKLHVQTSYSEARGQIVSSVFDNGRVIDKREVAYRNGTAGSGLQNRLTEIHRQTIDELETLFYVAEKVRAVRHAGSALRLGRLLLRRQLVEDAVSALRLALEVDPELTEARVLLAHALNQQGRYTETKELLEPHLSGTPEYADLHNALGEALFRLKELPAAEARFRHALSLNPDFAAAHYNLALALVAQMADEETPEPSNEETQEEALTHLQQALKLAPRLRSADVKAVFGLLRERKLKEAVERLVAAHPGPFAGPDLGFEDDFYLKFMYAGKGRDDTFIGDYTQKLQKVLTEYPGYADLHNNLGIAYLIQCRNLFLKALDEFRAALKINPDFRRAKKNLKIAENDGKGFLILLRALLK